MAIRLLAHATHVATPRGFLVAWLPLLPLFQLLLVRVTERPPAGSGRADALPFGGRLMGKGRWRLGRGGLHGGGDANAHRNRGAW